MTKFGGSWTTEKMDMVVKYANAYLTIMNKQKWAKTLYFDGFAGSGEIEMAGEQEIIKGTSLRILDITQPKPFDRYYFVEKDEKTSLILQAKINSAYPGRNAHAVHADCNDKLIGLAEYLKRNKNYRALAFIDPYGVTVNWTSIENLKGQGIDMWILVPTGIGMNRMLTRDGKISEAWLQRLELFLGMHREEITTYFYRQRNVNTLFGDELVVNKESKAVQRAGNLYKDRLQTVFNYVSEPFVMRNSTNSIMYHFMMATNNVHALRVANDVIKPKYKL